MFRRHVAQAKRIFDNLTIIYFCHKKFIYIFTIYNHCIFLNTFYLKSIFFIKMFCYSIRTNYTKFKPSNLIFYSPCI
mgnify:CR=1 FL=1